MPDYYYPEGDYYSDPYVDNFITTTRAGGGYGQPQGVLDPWQAIISQGIEAARDVARGATSNYPYTSPDDPYGNRPISVGVYAPSQTPPPYPTPGPAPLPSPSTPAPGGGIQLSTTTLMLLVGGFLLFSAGRRR